MFNNIVCFLILLVVLYLLYFCYNNYYYTCDCNKYSEEFKNNDNNKNKFILEKDTPMGYNMEKIICSKECCSTQWPTSVDIKDPNIDMKDYLPTNLNCNDGIHDTGCVCKKNI